MGVKECLPPPQKYLWVSLLFSWGNTFAASNLIYYEGKYFDKWNDNLIVGSLATKIKITAYHFYFYFFNTFP